MWLLVFCGSFSWFHGLVCSVWFEYFLIILTYFWNGHVAPTPSLMFGCYPTCDSWDLVWRMSRCLPLQLARYWNNKWVWSGNTAITNCRQTHGTARKIRSTITRHQENKPSKTAGSLFPVIRLKQIGFTYLCIRKLHQCLQNWYIQHMVHMTVL